MSFQVECLFHSRALAVRYLLTIVLKNSYLVKTVISWNNSLYLGCLVFLRVQVLIQWWCTGRQKRVTGLQLRFESETEVPQGPKWFGEVVRSDAIWWHVMACNQLGVTIWTRNVVNSSKLSSLNVLRLFLYVFACLIEIHPMVPMVRIRLCRQMLYGVKRMLSCDATPLRRWCWRRSSLKSPGTQTTRKTLRQEKRWQHDTNTEAEPMAAGQWGLCCGERRQRLLGEASGWPRVEKWTSHPGGLGLGATKDLSQSWFWELRTNQKCPNLSK